MKRPIHVLALAACLLFAACGGAATASAPVAASASAAAPTVTAAVPMSPSPASAPPSAAAGGDGAALCAFLQAELPALKKAGSTGGAVAQLALDYADWIAADPSRKLPDAATMDTLTQATCPTVRTDVLKTIGGDTFAGSF